MNRNLIVYHSTRKACFVEIQAADIVARCYLKPLLLNRQSLGKFSEMPNNFSPY